MRGIAIALVVVFHVFVGRVSGGVDVFLLLSGLFFLGSLIRHAEKPGSSLNPWWQIWRSLRRLYPSLVAVIAGCFLIIWLLIPHLQTRMISTQIMTSLMYIQNIKLMKLYSAYDAAGDSVSPFQHLWSMSVQFQFYVGSILIVYAVAFIARRLHARHGTITRPLTALIAVATIASFCYAWWLHDADQMRNYYSTLARLWEPGLGALLGLWLARQDNRRGGDAAARLPRSAAFTLVVLGVLLIAVTGAVVDGAAEFPGPTTLLPLGGAALVIIAGRTPNAASTWLASRPARFLGDIAYALYLWHWPLLILGLNIMDLREPTLPFGIAVIALSVILAWLTHIGIERPLRQRGGRPQASDPVIRDTIARLRTRRPARVRAGALAATAIVAIGLLPLPMMQTLQLSEDRAMPSDTGRYPGMRAVTDDAAVPAVDEVMPPYDTLDRMWSPAGTMGCAVEPAAPLGSFPATGADGTPCVFGDPQGGHTMVLLGGSHAEQWFSPINAIARKAGWRLEPMLRSACSGTLAPIDEMDPECTEWTRIALGKLADNPPDLLITTSTRSTGIDGDHTPDGYRMFWDELAELGIPVVGLRDNPRSVDADGLYFAPAGCVVDGGDPADCGPLRNRAYAPVNPADAILATYPDSLSIDIANELCGPVHCPAVIGNVWVYRDDDHMSDQIARSFAPYLSRHILPHLEEIAAGS